MRRGRGSGFGGPFGPGFGGPFFPGMSNSWKRQFKCKSIMYHSHDANADKTNYGGRIYLPESTLGQLQQLGNLEFPLMFKLTNDQNQRSTHAGVIQFTAPPDTVLMPYWMMRLLLLKDDEVITIDYTPDLPKASFAKLQPQSANFIQDITDHRAVLEVHLRDFTCLSKGDVISIHYNQRDFEILVMEVRSKSTGKEKEEDVVCIIDTDMNVDFETPVGYEEPTSSSIPIPKNSPKKSRELLKAATAGSPLGTPEVRQKIEEHLIKEAKDQGFVKFTGGANRLDGKKKGTKAKSNQVTADFTKYTRGIPNYDFQVGTVTFIRAGEHSTSGKDSTPFEAFGGDSNKLGKSKKSKSKK